MHTELIFLPKLKYYAKKINSFISQYINKDTNLPTLPSAADVKKIQRDLELKFPPSHSYNLLSSSSSPPSLSSSSSPNQVLALLRRIDTRIASLLESSTRLQSLINKPHHNATPSLLYDLDSNNKNNNDDAIGSDSTFDRDDDENHNSDDERSWSSLRAKYPPLPSSSSLWATFSPAQQKNKSSSASQEKQSNSPSSSSSSSNKSFDSFDPLSVSVDLTEESDEIDLRRASSQPSPSSHIKKLFSKPTGKKTQTIIIIIIIINDIQKRSPSYSFNC